MLGKNSTLLYLRYDNTLNALLVVPVIMLPDSANASMDTKEKVADVRLAQMIAVDMDVAFPTVTPVAVSVTWKITINSGIKTKLNNALVTVVTLVMTVQL